MSYKNEFEVLFKFLDNELVEEKYTDYGYSYYGLILDELFEDSILSIDYLSVEDYFIENGGFEYDDKVILSKKCANMSIDEQIKFIENILNIIKHTSLEKDKYTKMFIRVLNKIEGMDIRVFNPEQGILQLERVNILDSGSYCNIILIEDRIVRKELRSIYKNDEKLKKRMKYEFENMKKLEECPNILNVIAYNDKESSYIMERAEQNLYDYIKNNEVTKKERLKIVFDILSGMDHAHKNDIIHRDLHLGNIMKINKDFVICDFGLSKDESIERSLKTSHGSKNNHIFVDPRGIYDFTKLDKKSDIYSIGKVIEYIFTSNTENILNDDIRFIIDKCTNRDEKKRYSDISDIIMDMKNIERDIDINEEREHIINDIKSSVYNINVRKFLFDLLEEKSICDFLVKYRLSNFNNIILELADEDQIKILREIEDGFVEATGYGGFENYDIFAKISYEICKKSKIKSIVDIAMCILRVCGDYRYEANTYYENIKKSNL